MVANAVNVEHPAIERRAASELKDDTDLGERLVTVYVGELPDDDVNFALDRGASFARELVAHGRIDSAVLTLQGQQRIVAHGLENSGAEPLVMQMGK